MHRSQPFLLPHATLLCNTATYSLRKEPSLTLPPSPLDTSAGPLPNRGLVAPRPALLVHPSAQPHPLRTWCIPWWSRWPAACPW
eukprot:278381-Chlamydomonas_euryale.AAC.11